MNEGDDILSSEPAARMAALPVGCGDEPSPPRAVNGSGVTVGLEERFAAIKAKAVASGVRFVSAAELVANRLRREQRIRDRQAERSQARCDRRQAKQELRQQTGQRDAGSNQANVRQVMAASEDDFTTDDQARLDALGKPPMGEHSTFNIQHSTPNGPAEPTHQERQRLFAADGKGENQNELMLELLLKAVHPEFPRFDMAAVPRVGRGGWISKHVLIHEHFIDTPNSRASELRGSETHPGHVLVNRWQLEIDNSSDGSVTGQPGGVSCYSVCFREHSLRLAKERDQRDVGSIHGGKHE